MFQSVDQKLFFLFPWLAGIVSFVVLQIPAFASNSELSLWLFLTSSVLFGMAHGACDLLLLKMPRIKGGAVDFTGPQFWITYGLLFGVVLLCWKFAPLTAFLGFLVLTAIHWGTADFCDQDLNRKQRWLLGLSRGSTVVLAILYFADNEVNGVVSRVADSNHLIESAAAAWINIGFITAVVCHFAMIAALLTKRSQLALMHGIETILICCLFAFVPVFGALFVYFVFFHSYRHILRVWSVRSTNPKAVIRDYMQGLIILQKETFAIWILIVLGMVSWTLFRQPQPGPVAFMVEYLKLLAALTLPHALWIINIDECISPRNWFFNLKNPSFQGI